MLLATALSALACRPSVAALGSGTDAARRSADGLFAAFAFRFFNVHRDPQWAAARPLYARYALIPSRLFRDSTAWSVHTTGDSTRAIFLAASFADGQYTFRMKPAAPDPARIGDQRHFMQLTARGDNDYEWYTTVEHNVGSVRPADVARALMALFTAFEGRAGAAVRSDAASALPRTTRHMGQLIGVDTVVTNIAADGSTSARFAFRWRPDSLRRRYPAFATWLEKYVLPSTWELQLTDDRGGRFLLVSGQGGAVTARLRARDGTLVTLDGPPRPMPDSLVLRADFTTRFKLFRVGFTGLVASFVIIRSDRERAWTMRFQREPEWQFPLAVDRLIRTPLRRPFDDRGSELLLGVRDDLGPNTMSVRYARTVVNESAIMRWLGGLGAAAFSDFADASEVEENRFLAELFTALRADLPALTAASSSSP